MDRLGWGDTQSKDGWMGLTIYLTYDYAGLFRMYMTSFFSSYFARSPFLFVMCILCRRVVGD